MDFVKHPLIRPNSMEFREYQQNILDTARVKNLLCVLPTGLGKTPIAALLAAERLDEYPGSKILVLAPTKPLVNQHYESFKNFLTIPEEEFQVITGEVPQPERYVLYKKKRLIFATPQTIRNDLKHELLDLGEFVLLVIDEIHHAIGKYAYPYVSKAYRKKAMHPKILGLTASPGTTKEKIKEICSNCGIKRIETRIEEDADVSSYVQEKVFEWKEVELPTSFLEISEGLKQAYKKRIDKLRELKFIQRRYVSKKGLLELQSNLIKAIQKGHKRSFIGIRYTTQAIRIEHALGMLETQGITSLENYLQKLRADPKARLLLQDINMVRVAERSRKLKEMGCKHPKISALCSIIEQTFAEKPDSKVIIFASYRDTVSELVGVLSKIKGAKPIEFIGQRSGLTQQEQVQRIVDFREHRYNILVGTSISEEGLDIPAMDLAVFYEPVPSAIRSIQRRGRVGRQTVGRVMVLITKNTRDEAYYWTAKNKEKAMMDTLKTLSRGKAL